MTTNVSEHTTSRTQRGLLVSFSGTMAAGKSTAIERLAARRFVEFCNMWPGVLVTEANCDEHPTIWQRVTAAYTDKHQTLDTPLEIAS